MEAPPPPYYVSATQYSPCSAGQIMADGTRVRQGSVAANNYPLGQKLTINGKRYVVRDRIGHGSVLDIWTPSCSGAIAWGRRVVKVRVGWWQKKGRVIKTRVHIPKGW